MRLLAALTAAVTAYAVVMAVARRHEPRRPPRPSRSQRRSDLGRQLVQAGVHLSPARFRVTVIGAVIATTMVVWQLTDTLSLAVPAAVVVGLAPRAFLRRRYQAVLGERTAAWPEAVRDVLAHLSVGFTLPQALGALGSSGPLPLRPAFVRFDANAGLYGPVVALEQVRAELADPVADRIIEVLVAAHEHGNEVVIELLRSLVDNVGRDVQLRRTIASSQTELRAEAVVAAVLPFAVLGYLCVSSDPYRDFYSSPGGWVVIGIGATMSAGGWKLIGRIARVPAEQRVLADGDRR